MYSIAWLVACIILLFIAIISAYIYNSSYVIGAFVALITSVYTNSLILQFVVFTVTSFIVFAILSIIQDNFYSEKVYVEDNKK